MLTQFEVTNKIIRNRVNLGLKLNEHSILIHVSSMINTRIHPSYTVKVTRDQLGDLVGMKRTALASALKRLIDLNYLERVSTRHFILRVNCEIIISKCYGEDITLADDSL